MLKAEMKGKEQDAKMAIENLNETIKNMKENFILPLNKELQIKNKIFEQL